MCPHLGVPLCFRFLIPTVVRFVLVTELHILQMVYLYKDPNGDKIFSINTTVDTVTPNIAHAPGDKTGELAAMMERVKQLEKKIAEQYSKVKRGMILSFCPLSLVPIKSLLD